MTAGDNTAGREDEDDHDLLTFGEVDARLRDEIAAASNVSRLAEDGASSSTVLAAAERLTALEEALRRNRRQPVNDDHFEKFFGFKGTFVAPQKPLSAPEAPLEVRQEDVTTNSLD